jgi:hypothetical protein
LIVIKNIIKKTTPLKKLGCQKEDYRGQLKHNKSEEFIALAS